MPESTNLSKQEQCIRQAIATHSALVYRVAYGSLRNTSDAEDVTQEVFLKLLRCPRVLAAVQSQKAWLARVTINCSRSFIRTESNRRKRQDAYASKQESVVMEASEIEDLREAVKSLPEIYRLPVMLHYHEGFKQQEVADILKCPIGTVASRLQKAKSELKKRLETSSSVALVAVIDQGLENCAEPIELPNDLISKLEASIEKSMAASTLALSTKSYAFQGSARLFATISASCIAAVVLLVFSLSPYLSASPKVESVPILAETVVDKVEKAAPALVAKADSPLPFEDFMENLGKGDGFSPITGMRLEHGKLSGVIRDSKGELLAGARVCIYFRSVMGMSKYSQKTAFTDQKGYYQFSPFDSSDGIDAVPYEKPKAELLSKSLGLNSNGLSSSIVQREIPRKASHPQAQVKSPVQRMFMNKTLEINIQISADGFASTEKLNLNLSQAYNLNQDFELEEGRNLSGSLSSQEGEPLVGALISVVGECSSSKSKLKQHSISQEDGGFELRGLVEGSLLLQVILAGYQKQIFMIPANLDRALDLKLSKAGEFEVELTEAEGTPLANARLEIYKNGDFQMSVTANQDGIVSCNTLGVGSYEALVFRRGSHLWCMKKELATRSQERTRDKWIAPIGARLEGLIAEEAVFDPPTKGTSMLSIQLVGDRSQGLRFTGLSREGEFNFQHLLPGRYRILAGYYLSSQYARVLAFGYVDIEEGDSLRQVKLHSAEESMREISVRCLDMKGRAIAGAQVHLIYKGSSRSLSQQADEDGWIRWMGLPGYYMGMVEADGYKSKFKWNFQTHERDILSWRQSIRLQKELVFANDPQEELNAVLQSLQLHVRLTANASLRQLIQFLDDSYPGRIQLSEELKASTQLLDSELRTGMNCSLQQALRVIESSFGLNLSVHPDGLLLSLLP